MDYKLILIVITVISFLFIFTAVKFFENFESVPNIEKLNFSRLDTSSSNIDSYSPPTYDLQEEKLTKLKSSDDECSWDVIIRQKTGRDTQPVEQFVNIYDSNFGGLIGTNLGLN